MPHLARIGAEVRINMAINNAWFGAVHHFDDVDILPSLVGVKCPSLVIVGQDDFICGPAWNRLSFSRACQARGRCRESEGTAPDYLSSIRIAW